MPRKTRKQKQLAALRKQTQTSYDVLETITIKEKAPIQKSAEIREPKKTNAPLGQEELIITKYFLSDFRKTIFLTVVIFSLEFFLYYVTMNNYLLGSLRF